MANKTKGEDCILVEKSLEGKEYSHLKVSSRGLDIIVYSEDMGEKIKRCKFTKKGQNIYVLSMADHTGRWEVTPFEGPLLELMEMVKANFGFRLCQW